MNMPFDDQSAADFYFRLSHRNFGTHQAFEIHDICCDMPCMENMTHKNRTIKLIVWWDMTNNSLIRWQLFWRIIDFQLLLNNANSVLWMCKIRPNSQTIYIIKCNVAVCIHILSRFVLAFIDLLINISVTVIRLFTEVTSLQYDWLYISLNKSAVPQTYWSFLEARTK